MNITSENDNYGEDHDSDMEHHDHVLIGNEIDVSGGGDGGNDERPINADKAMQGNALPVDLARVWKRKPSPEFIHLLTNNMPPLHFLCTYAAKIWGPQTMVTMDYLLSMFPDDPKLLYCGMLPFHCACHAGARWSLLKWWWDKSPNIVQVITMDTGDTSLHCHSLSAQVALNASASHRQRQQCFLAIQFLVEKYPDALGKINRMGMLSFHVAAVHQAPLDILFYLATQNPEALLYDSSNIAVSDCVQLIP